MKTYRIRPLQWEGCDPYHDGKHLSDPNEHPWYEGGWIARVPCGAYQVKMPYCGGGLIWTYCFDEFYDEDSASCDSVEEGKQRCEEHWRQRILSALEEVTE